MSVWATPLQEVKRNREKVMKIGTLPTPLFFQFLTTFQHWYDSSTLKGSRRKSTFCIILRNITYHKGPVRVFSAVPVVAVVKSFSTKREVESHASILRAVNSFAVIVYYGWLCFLLQWGVYHPKGKLVETRLYRLTVIFCCLDSVLDVKM